MRRARTKLWAVDFGIWYKALPGRHICAGICQLQYHQFGAGQLSGQSLSTSLTHVLFETELRLAYCNAMIRIRLNLMQGHTCKDVYIGQITTTNDKPLNKHAILVVPNSSLVLDAALDSIAGVNRSGGHIAACGFNSKSISQHSKMYKDVLV